jgi:hypothetical protein
MAWRTSHLRLGRILAKPQAALRPLEQLRVVSRKLADLSDAGGYDGVPNAVSLRSFQERGERTASEVVQISHCVLRGDSQRRAGFRFCHHDHVLPGQSLRPAAPSAVVNRDIDFQ